MSVFDTDCLKGIERLEIGGHCFEKVDRFVIDGLNELESIVIGKNSFELDYQNSRGSRGVIMNCDQLSLIRFAYNSFWRYESFELKNLPSLISIQLGYAAFGPCHSIVFESEND